MDCPLGDTLRVKGATNRVGEGMAVVRRAPQAAWSPYLCAPCSACLLVLGVSQPIRVTEIEVCGQL